MAEANNKYHSPQPQKMSFKSLDRKISRRRNDAWRFHWYTKKLTLSVNRLVIED